MYLNFHTHGGPQASVTSIHNYAVGSQKNADMAAGRFFSAGIHPWDCKDLDVEKHLKELEGLLRQPQCLAMGELGLDKIFGTDLVYQREVFRAQLAVAQKCKTKVLIIHSVKAYEEIMEEKRRCGHSFYWVLHAFNGSPELIRSLVKRGFYFSIGHLLLNPATKIARSIQHIPVDRLFLETDESTEDIRAVYQKAAALRSIPEEILKERIQENALTFWPEIFR